MKNAMLVPIALIAIAGNAQTPEDLKIIREVVREVQKELTAEGMVGLKNKSMDYHKAAIGKKDRGSMIKCMAFDMQCHLIDSSMTESMKTNPYTYFTKPKLSERWMLLFETRSFSKPEDVQKLIQQITKSLQEETDKMLSE